MSQDAKALSRRVTELCGVPNPGWTWTSDSLVEAWEQMVEFVEEGYYDNIYEYNNDLFVRGKVQDVLDDEVARGLPGFAELRARLDALDARFRAVLFPEPSRDYGDWWHNHLPRYAGPELASDIANHYGLTIEVRQGGG
ncbi:hypothetical protein V5P93_004109 [Actinokineospora auranticolor]|uniref:Uncharacterized protein n=1 Tax=Actinokineospora auranticolor TaxID=155976 RepID=A0A2S6GD69_9PSEU|nr:hypothetical protein [Actinokineospora auranticolor]PPK63173.1 hypothetical protein CLV40_13142 [Actinokineospora auranticolor]